MRIVVEEAEELTTNAADGVGDCAGGVFRHIAQGDEALAAGLALFFKIFLVTLPLLSALQWLERARSGAKGLVGNVRVRKKKRFMRVLMRAFLGTMGLSQCLLLLYSNLNAANGSLMNFWLAFLIGAGFESLLSCDDIRGPFRQFVTAMVFIFI